MTPYFSCFCVSRTICSAKINTNYIVPVIFFYYALLSCELYSILSTVMYTVHDMNIFKYLVLQRVVSKVIFICLFIELN